MALVLALAGCATVGRTGDIPPGEDAAAGDDASLPTGDARPPFAIDGDVVFGDGSAIVAGSVVVTPADPTVVVTIVDGVVTRPSVPFAATSGGRSLNVGWSVDQGALATITSAGVFTPTGAAGGTVRVIAGYGTSTASSTVTIVVKRTQNGFSGPVDLSSPGGYGGVGGEGPGGPVSAGDVATLQQPPAADTSRSFLYPYEGTVWPRGLLAPLLQWTPGTTDATAISIHLESKTFVYDGYFGRPAALPAGVPFVRHPIVQDVWQQATESTSGGDPLTVRVVFLAGGAAVGPIARSWRVAPGLLEGTVYYESYGTLLVQNSDFQAQSGSHVGAGVLAIKPGETGPHVVAGASSPVVNGSTQWGTGCRGCHTVAARGSSLIVQDDVWPYETTSVYALQTLAESTMVPPGTPPGTFAWAALSPDGAYALTNGPLNTTATNLGETQLFQVGAAGATTPLTVAGLPHGTSGATPAFSPDGRHVSFTHVAGTLGTLAGDNKHVVVLDFDPAGPAMNNPRQVFTVPAGQNDCVGFESFLPTNDALLVQLQLAACNSSSFNPYIGTGNVRSEIWWTDIASVTQRRLDALNGYGPNGTSYLPVGPNGHDTDTTLNYEPTVSPAASGGYAWVIFTSRRLYGSVANINPFSSDPRYYDNAHQVTPKKLWVAAIDLNAPPGTDPSHPAFYLPAQELQAGNARGFWVLDPCKQDGAPCSAGDQCCGGYCQPAGDGGALVCGTSTPRCAQIGEKCVKSSDCCDPLAQCISGFCATTSPQ